MKTISAPAMAAIEAGTAIVTGAVQITPRGDPPPEATFETIDVIDLDALANCGTSVFDADSIPVGGFAADDVIRLSLPSGQTYTAWKYDSGLPWVNEFDVQIGSDSFRVNQNGLTVSSLSHAPFGFDTDEEARAAFGYQFITGATSYDFYICDLPGDNSGGVSVLIERRIPSEEEPTPLDALRIWGGYGPIEIDGEIYQGVGDRGLAQQNSGAIGGFAQGVTLTLSGLEPHVLSLLDEDEVALIRGGSVVLYRLIFASDGKTLLDAHVFDRGRVDTIESVETIGGGAAIKLAVETAARGLGSAGARQRSDADQRLINPTDGYFKNTSYAPEKALYWGGKRPVNTGAAVGGTSGSPLGGAGGGGGFRG